MEHTATDEETSAKNRKKRIYAILRMITGCQINLGIEEAFIKAGFKMREITKERVRKSLTHTIRGIAEKSNEGMQADDLKAAPDPHLIGIAHDNQ